MKSLLLLLVGGLLFAPGLLAQNQNGQYLLSRFGDIYIVEPTFEQRLNLTAEQESALSVAFAAWQEDPDVEAAFSEFQGARKTDDEEAKKAAWNARRGEARTRFVTAYQGILNEQQLAELGSFEELYRRLNDEAKALSPEGAPRSDIMEQLRKLWADALGPIEEHQAPPTTPTEPAAEPAEPSAEAPAQEPSAES